MMTAPDAVVLRPYQGECVVAPRGAYAAWRGDFVHATFRGGELGSAAVGRLLFTHDALATEAVGALVLVTLVGATAAWRLRDRGR